MHQRFVCVMLAILLLATGWSAAQTVPKPANPPLRIFGGRTYLAERQIDVVLQLTPDQLGAIQKAMAETVRSSELIALQSKASDKNLPAEERQQALQATRAPGQKAQEDYRARLRTILTPEQQSLVKSLTDFEGKAWIDVRKEKLEQLKSATGAELAALNAEVEKKTSEQIRAKIQEMLTPEQKKLLAEASAK